MAKPILSLKNKKPSIEAKIEAITEEVLNPLTVAEPSTWDYTPYNTPEEEEYAPRQRKRRKDKETEQYRKESRWQ